MNIIYLFDPFKNDDISNASDGEYWSHIEIFISLYASFRILT